MQNIKNKAFKKRQVFIRRGQRISGIYGKGTEANQVGQLWGFIAIADRPNFEALRQVWRAAMALTIGAVVKFKPCI